MARLIETDASDPRLEPYHDLRSNRKWASPDGFIIETEIVLERLIESRFEIIEIVTSETKAERLRATLPKSCDTFVLSRDELEKLVGFDLHRGVLARARRPDTLFPPTFAPLVDGQRWLFCENITDPGNVGTLIRIASTLGFNGVYFDQKSTNPFSRRSARSSAGHIFRIPVHVIETKVLLDHFVNGTILAAALSESHIDSFELNQSTKPTLLAVGNEGFGLTKDVLKVADQIIQIPMVTSGDSLNVATAAAILCHQLSPLRPAK